MGISLYVSIGPYIEVLGTKKITQTNVRLGCPNHHSNKTFSKFCSECGAEVITIEYEESKILTPSSLISSMGLNWNLYSTECLPSIFIPDIKVPDKYKFDTEAENAIDLSDINIMLSQINWMKETYKKEIDFLIENFGEDSVFIKWGIISDWG